MIKTKHKGNAGNNGQADARVPVYVEEMPAFIPDSMPRAPVEGSLPLFASRLDLALNRILHSVNPTSTRPHLPFPLSELIQHIPIPHNIWNKIPIRPDSALGRVLMMLEVAPCRAFPKSFVPYTRKLSSLEGWNDIERTIAQLGYNELVQIRNQMYKRRIPVETHGGPEVWTTEPLSYEVNLKSIRSQSRSTWRICQEVGKKIRNGSIQESEIFLFLRFYNRTLNPLNPILLAQELEVSIFAELAKFTKDEIPKKRSRRLDAIYAAQLAQEAVWLSLPGNQDSTFAYFGRHHEQNYTNLDVFSLPRGEFSNPKIVTTIIREILEPLQGKTDSTPQVTPITVGYYQAPGAKSITPFIIDGNNRSTATAFITFAHWCEGDIERFMDLSVIGDFCRQRMIQPKWEYELRHTAIALREDPYLVELIYASRNHLETIANGKIPALVAHEPNFLTLDVGQSVPGERLAFLQPFVQCLVNGSGLPAISSKQQSHGRAPDGNILRPYR